MALVSRSKNRRNLGSRQLSGQAEACETRALLSAVATCVDTTDIQDFVNAEPEFSEDPASSAVDGEWISLENNTFPTDWPVESWDQSWLYQSLTSLMFTGDDQTSDIELLEMATPDGWDPSWVEQGLVFMATPDGWDPSWVEQGLVVSDVDPSNSEDSGPMFWSFGAPDGESPQGWEPGLACGDGTDGTLVSGGEFSDGQAVGGIDEFGEWMKDGFENTWVLRGNPDGIDMELYEANVMYVFDPPPFQDFFGSGGGGEDVDPREGGLVDDMEDTTAPVDFTSDGPIEDGPTNDGPTNDGSSTDLDFLPDDLDSQIYAMYSFGVPGGPEVQRTVDSVDPIPTPIVVIRPVTAQTPVLFSGIDARASVATLIAHNDQSPAPISEISPTSAVPTRRGKSRGQSSSNVASTAIELNGLSPLFERANDAPAPMTSPRRSEDERIDERADEEPVAVSDDNAEFGSGRYAAAPVDSTPVTGVVRTSQAGDSRPVVLDQFMTLFAHDSFIT